MQRSIDPGRVSLGEVCGQLFFTLTTVRLSLIGHVKDVNIRD